MFVLIAVISVLILFLISKFLFSKNKIRVSNRPLVLAVNLLILVAGLVLVYVNINEFNAYLTRETWLTTTGEIISFDIVGVKTREPDIGYQFESKGFTYKDTTNLATPFFGSRNYQEQTARVIEGNYKVGDSVIVYYNPVNPKESALKITPHWSTYMQFTFAIMVISVVLALLFPQKSKQDKDLK